MCSGGIPGLIFGVLEGSGGGLGVFFSPLFVAKPTKAKSIKLAVVHFYRILSENGSNMAAQDLQNFTRWDRKGSGSDFYGC